MPPRTETYLSSKFVGDVFPRHCAVNILAILPALLYDFNATLSARPRHI